jgi:hypothetical protein
MTVTEIAQLTGYTARHIREECRLGLLPARIQKATTWQEDYYVIEEKDFAQWRDNPPRKRRAWKGKRS